MSFDYKRALNEIAWPEYGRLSQGIRDLYLLVERTMRSVGQDSYLEIPWNETLKGKFAQVETEELAWAARVIYYASHWAYSEEVRGKCEVCQGTGGLPLGRKCETCSGGGTVRTGWTRYGLHGKGGGGWKFANLADQELRERHGQKRIKGQVKDPLVNGWGMQIHQGTARITNEAKDWWVWEEMAPATEETVGAIRMCLLAWPRVSDPEKAKARMEKLKELVQDQRTRDWDEGVKRCISGPQEVIAICFNRKS